MAHVVLVVEDNPTNMKLAVLLLESAGLRVLCADNARDGIALARAEAPQLVLMDIQLPGMDGLEATRLLKTDPATRGIQVIALTASAMREEEERIRAAGCDGYITKPIDCQQFLAEIGRRLTVTERTEND